MYHFYQENTENQTDSVTFLRFPTSLHFTCDSMAKGEGGKQDKRKQSIRESENGAAEAGQDQNDTPEVFREFKLSVSTHKAFTLCCFLVLLLVLKWCCSNVISISSHQLTLTPVVFCNCLNRWRKIAEMYGPLPPCPICCLPFLTVLLSLVHSVSPPVYPFPVLWLWLWLWFWLWLWLGPTS